MQLGTFIAGRIIKAANESLASGQDKYRAYLINTTLYLPWQDAVDNILETTFTDVYPDGYGNCIITE